MQAIVICQYLDPPDYTFAFALLKDHAGQVLEFMFDYLWDMTIIEYLICICPTNLFLFHKIDWFLLIDSYKLILMHNIFLNKKSLYRSPSQARRQH